MEGWNGPEPWALVVVGFFIVATLLCILIAWGHQGRRHRD
jgi:hypothetical protein